MKRTKTIALAITTALGIGFAGASVAGFGYDASGSRAAQPMGTSVAAMDAHFGAHPGTISYFNDGGSPTIVSQVDLQPGAESSVDSRVGAQPDFNGSAEPRADFQPAASSSVDSEIPVPVDEPTLVFSDGAWYSYNAGDWYALEGGEWYPIHGAAMADGSSVDDVTWYYVTEIPVEMIVHSADGTEQYVLEGDQLVVFTPLATSSEVSGPMASAETADSGFAPF